MWSCVCTAVNSACVASYALPSALEMLMCINTAFINRGNCLRLWFGKRLNCKLTSGFVLWDSPDDGQIEIRMSSPVLLCCCVVSCWKEDVQQLHCCFLWVRALWANGKALLRWQCNSLQCNKLHCNWSVGWFFIINSGSIPRVWCARRLLRCWRLSPQPSRTGGSHSLSLSCGEVLALPSVSSEWSVHEDAFVWWPSPRSLNCRGWCRGTFSP